MAGDDFDRDFEIRLGTSADTAAVVALIESAYRGEVSRAGWTTEADLLDGQRTDAAEISGILAEPEARLLLATRGPAIIGCVLLRREATGAYIGMLAVCPDLQAKGLGKALLNEAEHRGRTEFAATRARMTVIAQRIDLIAWYVRRGYRVTNRTEPFPYGDRRFGVPKRGDLRFVILEKPLQ
jgi:ribosomal protein S18 acetylase RimI-like enzyme